jgi:hypothetical protein
LFHLEREASGQVAEMFVKTADGREFHSDSHREYGLIVRYSPDQGNYPNRRWFLVAGLGPAGTVGAAWYLAQNWRYVAKLVSADEDFAAFVTVPVMAPTSAQLREADIARKVR